MPSWWGKSSSTKEPKEPKKQKSKDGMRLQIGGWKSKLSSWTDDERKNSSSPGCRSSSDNSNCSRPLSPCTPCADRDPTRQPWPLPSAPSPQATSDIGRKNQSLPLPPPRHQHKSRAEADVCATSASSSISSSGSGEACDASHHTASLARTGKSPVSLKLGSSVNGDRSPSPCFSPTRSPRGILDAGDAFFPAFSSYLIGATATAASTRDKSPNLSPVPSPKPGTLNSRTQQHQHQHQHQHHHQHQQQQSGQLSPRHTLHPLPSPPGNGGGGGGGASSAFPLSPTLSPSNNRSATTTCWQKGKLIGNGTFGYVYVGFDSNNIGRMCAMKEVHIIGDNDQSKESAKQLGQEITLLSRLSHPNIVQYYGSESVDDKLYIYLEYVSGGSIHKLLQDYGPFKESVIRRYTRQILSGLSFLHSMETVHRDIKGANILVDTNGVVKLADFGMAKHITAQSFPLSCKGSPYWMAPEILKSTHRYDLSVDIWSLGCTVIEMATGKPPWSEFEGVAVLFKIGNSKEIPPIPQILSEEGQHFLRLCLQRDAANRPTAAELMEHPFVVDVQDSNFQESYQTQAVNISDSYQSPVRFMSTPPRQVCSAPAAPSSFGFHFDNVALHKADSDRRLRRNSYTDSPSYFSQKMGNGAEISAGVISDIHQQRLASCLDLKC